MTITDISDVPWCIKYQEVGVNMFTLQLLPEELKKETDKTEGKWKIGKWEVGTAIEHLMFMCVLIYFIHSNLGLLAIFITIYKSIKQQLIQKFSDNVIYTYLQQCARINFTFVSNSISTLFDTLPSSVTVSPPPYTERFTSSLTQL